MKVVFKDDAMKPVSEVRPGQCFMKGGSLFMKAYRDSDYAVDLEDGIIYILVDMDEQVFPIVAKAVVE